MRAWFNRTFSSVYSAIGLIREAGLGGRFLFGAHQHDAQPLTSDASSQLTITKRLP